MRALLIACAGLALMSAAPAFAADQTAPAPAPSSLSAFRVHVATLPDQAHADSVAQLLAAQVGPASINRPSAGDTAGFKVIVEDLRTPAEAAQVVEQVRKLGFADARVLAPAQTN